MLDCINILQNECTTHQFIWYDIRINEAGKYGIVPRLKYLLSYPVAAILCGVLAHSTYKVNLKDQTFPLWLQIVCNKCVTNIQ